MQRRNDRNTTIIVANVVLGGALSDLLDLLKKTVPQAIACMPSHCDVKQRIVLHSKVQFCNA